LITCARVAPFSLIVRNTKTALTLTWARRVGVLALAYYVAGRLGLAIPQLGPHITRDLAPPASRSPRCCAGAPASGRVSPSARLAVALGSGARLGGLGLALGNAVGPTLAAWALQRLGLHHALDRRRDLWLFSGIGAGAAMLVTCGQRRSVALARRLLGSADVPSAWLYWWLGDSVGALLRRRPLLTLSRQRCGAPAPIGAGVADRCCAWPRSAPAARLRCRSPWADALVAVRVRAAPAAVLAGDPQRHFRRGDDRAAARRGAALATATGHGPSSKARRPTAWRCCGAMSCTLSAAPLLVTALVGELTANDERWQLASTARTSASPNGTCAAAW
jgi:hypothetical protein